MIITLDSLRNSNERWCEEQIELLEQLFGEQVELTEENIVHAWTSGVDIDYYFYLTGNSPFMDARDELVESLDDHTVSIIFDSGPEYISKRLALGEEGIRAYLPVVRQYAELIMEHFGEEN